MLRSFSTHTVAFRGQKTHLAWNRLLANQTDGSATEGGQTPGVGRVLGFWSRLHPVPK